MTNLYYTIERQTQMIDTIEECTGWDTIRVYEIANDIPKLWFELEAKSENFIFQEIQTWLDNNGFEDREYFFTEL